MRCCVLFSGGKDSTYALHVAKEAGHDIVCLLAMHPQNSDSMMFHTPNTEWTRLQAEAMGIPLVHVFTMGKEGKEMQDLKNALQELKKSARIQAVVTGAIRSIYQAAEIERVCSELDVFCFSPLWMAKDEAHWHELLLRGFDIVLVRVAASGLEKDWLGRQMNEASVRQLVSESKKGHFPSSIGEGGEFESFVCDAPLFTKRIVIEKYRDEWKGLQGTRHILSAKLVGKKEEKVETGKKEKKKKGNKKIVKKKKTLRANIKNKRSKRK